MLGVGEVRGDVRKGEGREEMWGSVLGLHTQTHFTPKHTSLNLPHSSSHMPTHFPTHPTLLHSPHIFPYLPPHPNTLPYTFPHTPLPTAPFTSRYTPTHFPTHPMHLLPNPPQFRVCGKVIPEMFRSRSRSQSQTNFSGAGLDSELSLTSKLE